MISSSKVYGRMSGIVPAFLREENNNDEPLFPYIYGVLILIANGVALLVPLLQPHVPKLPHASSQLCISQNSLREEKEENKKEEETLNGGGRPGRAAMSDGN